MHTDTFSEINAIAERLAPRVDRQALENLRHRAIGGSMTLDTFREAALSLLPGLSPVSMPQSLDLKPKDWQRYSLARAVLGQVDRSIDNGFEREVSRALEGKHNGRPEGLLIPDEFMAGMTRNAVAGTGTLGGMLVQTDNLASDFISVLRNKSQVLNLGARVLNLSNQSTIPRQSAAATANWVSETAASTLSGVQLQQLTLTPQAISANVQYSKMLLVESNPTIDMILRDDIAAILATAIDLAALHGTGSGQPTGIISTSGIGSVLLATNGLSLANATAYPAMVSLETTVAAANADGGSLAYLMRPGARAQMKTQVRFTNTDTPVYLTTILNGIASGQVNGYRAEVSNQVSGALTTGTATTITTPVFFGNWSDLIVANFGSTDLVVDPYTLAQNGVVRILARRWVDVGVRRAASFAVLGGILGG